MEDLQEHDRVALFAQTLSMRTKLDHQLIQGQLIFINKAADGAILKLAEKGSRKFKLKLVNLRQVQQVRVVGKSSSEQVRQEMRCCSIDVQSAMEREFRLQEE